MQQRRENLDHRLDVAGLRASASWRIVEASTRGKPSRTAPGRNASPRWSASLAPAYAKDLLLQQVEADARMDARIIHESEAKAHEEAERKAREIITMAISASPDQVARRRYRRSNPRRRDEGASVAAAQYPHYREHHRGRPGDRRHPGSSHPISLTPCAAKWYARPTRLIRTGASTRRALKRWSRAREELTPPSARG